MIENLKKTFEFPLIEIVKFDVKTIVAAYDSWEDDEDWGAGEF